MLITTINLSSVTKISVVIEDLSVVTCDRYKPRRPKDPGRCLATRRPCVLRGPAHTNQPDLTFRLEPLINQSCGSDQGRFPSALFNVDGPCLEPGVSRILPASVFSSLQQKHGVAPHAPAIALVCTQVPNPAWRVEVGVRGLKA